MKSFIKMLYISKILKGNWVFRILSLLVEFAIHDYLPDV